MKNTISLISKGISVLLLVCLAFGLCNCKRVRYRILKTKIDITVTDGNTGLPVKNAKVNIFGTNRLKDNIMPGKDIDFISFQGLTDEDGKFYYEFRPKLKSSRKYRYSCSLGVHYPDGSNYTKGALVSNTSTLINDYTLGKTNVFNLIFY